MPRPAGKELFDAAVGEGALDGEGLRELHLNVVSGGEVEAAIDRLFAFGAGMAEGEDLSAGVHGCVKMSDHGGYERLGQIVEGGPQQDDVKGAAGEGERVIEEALHVPDGLAVFVDAGGPVGVGGIANQVSEEDALSEAGEVIDICRGSISNVDDAEAGLRL